MIDYQATSELPFEHDPEIPGELEDELDWDGFNPFIQPPQECQFCGSMTGETYLCHGVYVVTCPEHRI